MSGEVADLALSRGKLLKLGCFFWAGGKVREQLEERPPRHTEDVQKSEQQLPERDDLRPMFRQGPVCWRRSRVNARWGSHLECSDHRPGEAADSLNGLSGFFHLSMLRNRSTSAAEFSGWSSTTSPA